MLQVANSAIRECSSVDVTGKGFMDNTKADWYDPEAEKEGS